MDAETTIQAAFHQLNAAAGEKRAMKLRLKDLPVITVEPAVQGTSYTRTGCGKT